MSTFDPAAPAPEGTPIGEDDLHGYVDRQLSAARGEEVERYLATHLDERERVAAWQRHKELLHGLLDPVMREPLPPRLAQRRVTPTFEWRGLAAGLALAVVAAATAWSVRGAVDREAAQATASALPGASSAARGSDGAPTTDLSGFALRAAVAHSVYSPEVRRPVEVGAEQEQQLVTWLSKRLGTPIKAPALKAIGYELIGGRLLPGDSGPVAQFMYHDGAGQRLTLYVTREQAKPSARAQTAFQFGSDGPVNVFYWIDKDFGYALSGAADRAELSRVSQEVYRQLGGT